MLLCPAVRSLAMPVHKDITGERFGSLVAVEYTYRFLSNGRRMPAWKLICDCGNEAVAMTVNLMKGKHKSCGCKRGELSTETREFLGVTSMPEYRIYRQMLDRCYLGTAPNYQYYGALGVEVCDRWRFGEDGRTGFLCFYGDMGPRPDGLTLDREDPFQSYAPSNCHWATWKHQAKNKREHHMTGVERVNLAKKRASKGRRKSNDRIVYAVRRRLSSGEAQTSIARRSGISQALVSKIKLGEFKPVAEMGL